MPLRDHFHPPLDDLRRWESLHSGWPMMDLHRKLPDRYFAELRVHSGASVEIDVATFEDIRRQRPVSAEENTSGGAATAVWAPPRPTLAVVTDFQVQDVYEVQVLDRKHKCRLVAAIEIVSPANKDRPEHRRAFVSKCASLLRESVSIVIIDLVTTRTHNLYFELLEFLGQNDPHNDGGTTTYAASCRITPRLDNWMLEAWYNRLRQGEQLPTMPLWVADDLAIPLELEESYEQSCIILNIP
jgi:hypothetical protein